MTRNEPPPNGDGSLALVGVASAGASSIEQPVAALINGNATPTPARR
jgi:hypothetical protein